MKKKVFVSRLLGMALVLCMAVAALGCLPVVAAGESQGTVTANVENHDYRNYGVRATPIGSHLVDNGDGTLTRVEYTGENIVVETYGSDLSFISGFTVDMELPIYGGFFYGSDRNFLVFGQRNEKSSDDVEVIRVVSYTRDWERIGAASLYGANTVDPIYSGCLRFAEYGGHLYIRTSHKMYRYTDGLYHQANMTLNIRIEDMIVTDSQTNVSDMAYGCVSHSFNQFIGVDGDRLVAVDHGDGNPRAVTLIRYLTPAGGDSMFEDYRLVIPEDGYRYRCYVDNVDVLPIAGEKGDNTTGVRVGGFQISDSHYLIAGATVKHDETYDSGNQRNIFISSTDKNNFTDEGTSIHYLTDWQEGDNVTVATPHMVDLKNGNYMILWTETVDRIQTTKYCLLNQKGLPVDGKIYSPAGALSDCVPIVFDGKLLWYVTSASAPQFMSIDLNDLSQATYDHVYWYSYDYYPNRYYSGLLRSTCMLCGEAGEDVIIPSTTNVEAYRIVSVSTEPTCTEGGWYKGYWKDAKLYNVEDYSYSVPIPATGHSYQAEVTDPTCTQKGYTTYTCADCGDSYTADETPKKEHTPGEWIIEKAATATEDGLECRFCTACGELTESRSIDRYVTGSSGSSISWHLNRNTGVLSVFGSGAMNQTYIPWHNYLSEIKRVEIAEGVEQLCPAAFQYCSALTQVTLPSTLKSIPYCGFSDCPTLIRIDVPDAVTSIGAYAFYGCSALEEITLPESLTTIERCSFYGCSSLKQISIPEGVTELPDSMFVNCSSLSNVTLPESLTAVDTKVFFNCGALTELTLPQNLTTIGNMAFYKCYGLEQLVIPAQVTDVGSGAFYNNTFQTLTFLGDAPALADDAFSKLTATVRYPAGNETWETVAGKSYSGTVTWETWGEVPVIRPTLTLKAPTLEFKDMITVNAMFEASNIQDVVEMGMITYTSQVSSWSVETAAYVIPGTTYDAATGRYIACSQGIHAKYLGDKVYLAVYARLADGTYAYSKLASYSPVQYATSKLSGTDTKLKQLVVAMLNYGAEAQLFFGHNTGSLANASLTAEQKALPAVYSASMVSSVPAASAAKQGSFANNSGFAKRYPSISFEGAFCINYFFTPNYAPASGITLYYWNEADYNAADLLTTANASGSFKLEGEGTAEYRGDIAQIAAKDLSGAVYVAAVYSDGTTEWTSGVLGYSIGAYCASQASKDVEVTALAKATAVYGYHAKAYFG